MIEINLLPKELQYKRFAFSVNKNVIYILVIGISIAGLLAAYSYVFQVNKINGLENEIRTAENETAKYAEEIKKIEDISLKNKQITERMTAIQVLDQNRNYWVKLMEDLIRRVPEYLWLTAVDQHPSTGNQPGGAAQAQAASTKSAIEGYSFSLNAFATFLVRLKKSDIFKNVEVVYIKLQETEKAKAYSFKIVCDFAQSERPMATAEPAKTAPVSGTQF